MPIGAEQRYYLKLKAAYYYYEKDYTQSEIAEMLNVSRITLGKLLKEAREERIVKIEIVDHRNVKHLLELEATLKDRFGLTDIKVVDCVENERREVTHKIAVAAAKYVEHILRSGVKVGVAWGRTLEQMVSNLNENRTTSDIEVVTLMGGAGTARSSSQPNIIAQRLIQKFGGSGYIINAPYICQTEELCEAIKAEPHIHDVIERTKQADITLVGIGEKPSHSPDYDANYGYGSETIDEILAAGAVGDICARYYDINGKPCNTSVCRRVVSIELEDLKQHSRVIAIGGGPQKHQSVLGALRSGYLDVLITDKFTAQAVVDSLKP